MVVKKIVFSGNPESDSSSRVITEVESSLEKVRSLP